MGWETNQWLRALVDLPKDPCLSSSIHMAALSCLQFQCWKIQHPLLACVGTIHTLYTYIHASKTPVHKKNKVKTKNKFKKELHLLWKNLQWGAECSLGALTRQKEKMPKQGLLRSQPRRTPGMWVWWNVPVPAKLIWRTKNQPYVFTTSWPTQMPPSPAAPTHSFGKLNFLCIIGIHNPEEKHENKTQCDFCPLVLKQFVPSDRDPKTRLLISWKRLTLKIWTWFW